MAEPIQTPFQINEYICEVRFKLKDKVLYDLDSVAKRVAEHMELSNWKVTIRRLEVSDAAQRWLGFSSDYHAGFVGRRCTSPEEFADTASKFLRFIFNREPYGDSFEVDHIGVKTSFADEFTGKYNDLLERFKTRLFSKGPNGESILQGYLNEESEPTIAGVKGKINFNGGPIKKKKVTQLFKFAKNPPDAALFTEIDYWLAPKKVIKVYQIFTTIRTCALQNHGWYSKIKRVVFE